MKNYKYPLITIITACYNSESSIENCIKSVLQQIYPHIEYIIIDGQSSDNTFQLTKKYCDNIDILISEPDSGIYFAWNKGIRNSTGDYIFFLNSDDILYDNQVIEDVAQHIMSKDFPVALHGKVMAVESESSYSFIDGRASKIDDFIYKMHYCTPAAFVSRHAYSRIGYFDENYMISSDYDWAIRLFKGYDSNKILFYDRIITQFSLGGCSNVNYKLAYKEVSRIVYKHFSFYMYIKHCIYVRFLLAVKTILPFLRKSGLLKFWRKLKLNKK